MKSKPDATGNVSWLCKLTGKFRKHIPIFFFFSEPWNSSLPYIQECCGPDQSKWTRAVNI